MGREVIGECVTSEEFPDLADYEMDLMVKFIKQECGAPARGVDVEVVWEDHELGGYPVIAVVWDDYTVECPYDYVE
jgi:hypothetical protein